jgi:hypothetical protein
MIRYVSRKIQNGCVERKLPIIVYSVIYIQRPNYETWLNQIVAVYQTHLDSKDKTFSRFLLDLPSVPPDVLSLLREMCVEPDR